MSDMKEFSQGLAEEAKRKLSSLETADRMQLHTRRILDAGSRPFWTDFKRELSAGIAEYDSCLVGTSLEQQRSISESGESLTITWRYPSPQRLSVVFGYELRLIQITKGNLNDTAAVGRTFNLSIDREDRLLASASISDGGALVGGAVELAQAVLRFMMTGSGT